MKDKASAVRAVGWLGTSGYQITINESARVAAEKARSERQFSKSSESPATEPAISSPKKRRT